MALNLRRKAFTCWLAALAAATSAEVGRAQVLVSEVLANPLSPNDAVWEWIEIKNMGVTPLDLNGYIAGKFGEEPDVTVDITNTLAANTSIPANGVGVLYDGSVTNYNDTVFRQAWGLSPSVPLVAVTGWPSLSNSGMDSRQFGFWENQTAYEADINAISGLIAGYANAKFSLNYGAAGFPPVTDASGSSGRPSMQWDGVGDNQLGASWVLSSPGGSTVTSIPVAAPQDVGNPGLVPAGTKPAGVFFTEIMYNPRADEPQWEWVEVFNNSLSTIDFGASPGVLDDDDGTLRPSANILSGTIAPNSSAILFNASGSVATAITLAQFQAAWDPGGTNGLNIIPVTGTSSTQFELNQTGDTLGVWPSFAEYSAEGGRNPAHALATVSYDDEVVSEPNTTGVWPTDNGTASIYRTNYDAASVGENWALSAVGDSIGSFAAIQTIHPGGDVGSPGSFGTATVMDADFNNDTKVDGADFLIWQRNLGSGTGNSTGDADGNNIVDANDLAVFKTQYGMTIPVVSAVPEPAAIGLSMLGIAACSLAGRRRRSK